MKTEDRHASTLVDILRFRAALHPNRLAYIYLQDGEREEAKLTYGELDLRARAIAAHLQQAGLAGQRVLLLYPSGLEFVAAFWGCLYGGVVPIPSYPPHPSTLHRRLSKLQALIRDAAPSAVLSPQVIRAKCLPLFEHSPEFHSLNWMATEEIAEALAETWHQPEIDETSLALLQYTSGSTATPKGVMVSHRSLLHNQSLIQQAFDQNEQSIIVGWLPLYHDMGLIGNVIQPIFVGAHCILMSPLAFLQKPYRWLQAISHYRATTSGGPNFAYDLCVRKITPSQLGALDLSCWRVAFNGAEPIRHETLRRFTDTFSASGFRHDAWAPCYGLAEATLFVAGGLQRSQTMNRSFQTKALEQGRVVETTDHQSRTLISCGRLLPEPRIQIVNPQTLQPCSKDEIGEIWISGTSVAQGYWNRQEESRANFAARLATGDAYGFLRTGDFGFLHQGELFITGRLKDLLIIRGRNHYPQDIEQTVERCHSALRSNGGAAFSIERGGEERLVVIQEVEPRTISFDAEAVITAIRHAVADQHELHTYAVLLVKAGSLSRTTSGKIQRRLCRERFLREEFDIIASDRMEESFVDGPEMMLTTEALLSLSPPERQTALEDYLQRLVAQIVNLPLSKIEKTAPIFAYGLDSLKAVELRNEIEASLNLAVPMQRLLGDSSITELSASLLDEVAGEAATDFAPLLIDHKETGEAELTHGQKALWFLHNLYADTAAYHIASAMRIQSALDQEIVRKCFQQLATRHTALRTTFHAVAGEPVQRIHEQLEPSFLAIEISGYNDEEALHKLVTEARRPFDLERGPLMRVALFRRNEDDNILLVVLHHIIADFWSMGILIEEFSKLYAAHRRGEDAAFLPDGLQFIDAALWQNRRLKGDEGQRLWKYWEKKLAGELPTLSLPADHLRPAIQSLTGAIWPFEIPGELTNRLKSLSSTHGVTLYVLILSAFQLMVSKLGGQRDILVGSPMSGRRHTGSNDVVGYMVNPVALRTKLEDEMSLADLLHRVRQSVIEALDHQEFPFQLLVERLQPGRNTGVNPIFQVMFTYHQTKPGQQALGATAVHKAGVPMATGELLLESMAFDMQTAQFDLSLAMVELDDGLAGCFQYSVELFKQETVQRMAGHFKRVLEQLSDGMELKVSEVELISVEEQQQLREWNATAKEYERSRPIHELFEEQVEARGAAIAVESEREAVSYEELNRRANQLARRLRRMGVRGETRVGILLERGVEMVVSILAVLKAGGAYVPLDASYPQERLDYMIGDAGVELVVSEGEHIRKAMSARQVIEVGAMREEMQKESAEDLGVKVEMENAAYVIYTSGSTGLPKGVVNSHGGLFNRLLWMQEIYLMTTLDAVLQKTPFSFDVSVWEFFWPLLYGARLVMARPDGHKDPAYLVKVIDDRQITILHFVPSMLHTFLEEPQAQNCKSLRIVICSGEALSLELARKFSTLLPARLDNLYGPTEAAIDVTFFDCQVLQPYIDNRLSLQTVPIGKPIANTQIYVLDEFLQVVPIGVAGELYIAGDGLARGYLHRPDLTAERFLPNPFSTTPGARMYRTGDRARWLADGNLEYLGRLDQQVKLRGFRIELGEIEAALLSHPLIRQAVVVAQGEEANKRLVAYVVSESEGAIQQGMVREYLREKLPEYMVPSAVVELAQVPLTSNGKVDRRALPAVEVSAATSGYVAARSGVEAALVEIWQAVLGVERVGVHDNFFELGGHSLLVTQVVARIRDKFHVQLPVMNFFQNPTIEGMALAVLQTQAEHQQADELGELLDVLENLSQDEVLARLEKASQV